MSKQYHIRWRKCQKYFYVTHWQKNSWHFGLLYLYWKCIAYNFFCTKHVPHRLMKLAHSAKPTLYIARIYHKFLLSWPLWSNSRYKSKNDADEVVSVVSLTSSSGGYINGRNSANLELLIDKTSSIYLYVKLKALASWIFLSFTSFWRNSDSYEYKNKLAHSAKPTLYIARIYLFQTGHRWRFALLKLVKSTWMV